MILSIDTFSDVLGICLLDEKYNLKFLVEYRQYKPFSETIIYELDLLLKKFDISKKDISSVVVNKGPGSYTGLRVGITTAKTLAYALNINLYAYTSLDGMFHPYKNCGKTILTAVNAGKNEAYIKIFNKKENPKILLVKQDKIKEYIKECDICITKNINLDGCISIRNSLALDGALFSLENNLKVDIFSLEPFYIRNL
jgi:tRNA threonylcarbamoyladenosine biosynthesis protein TsaB